MRAAYFDVIKYFEHLLNIIFLFRSDDRFGLISIF